MKERNWQILAYGIIILPAMACFYYLVYSVMFEPRPRSHEPNYYAVYWVESNLYMGSTCEEAETVYDHLAPNLVECREGGLPVFVNKRNGTVLLVKNNFKIKDRWLPNGERVFVDYDNGYVFWAKDGKVTNFVQLTPEIKGQLLVMPPQTPSPMETWGPPAKTPSGEFNSPEGAEDDEK